MKNMMNGLPERLLPGSQKDYDLSFQGPQGQAGRGMQLERITEGGAGGGMPLLRGDHQLAVGLQVSGQNNNTRPLMMTEEEVQLDQAHTEVNPYVNPKNLGVGKYHGIEIFPYEVTDSYWTKPENYIYTEYALAEFQKKRLKNFKKLEKENSNPGGMGIINQVELQKTLAELEIQNLNVSQPFPENYPRSALDRSIDPLKIEANDQFVRRSNLDPIRDQTLLKEVEKIPSVDPSKYQQICAKAESHFKIYEEPYRGNWEKFFDDIENETVFRQWMLQYRGNPKDKKPLKHFVEAVVLEKAEVFQSQGMSRRKVFEHAYYYTKHKFTNQSQDYWQKFLASDANQRVRKFVENEIRACIAKHRKAKEGKRPELEDEPLDPRIMAAVERITADAEERMQKQAELENGAVKSPIKDIERRGQRYWNYDKEDWEYWHADDEKGDSAKQQDSVDAQNSAGTLDQSSARGANMGRAITGASNQAASQQQENGGPKPFGAAGGQSNQFITGGQSNQFTSGMGVSMGMGAPNFPSSVGSVGSVMPFNSSVAPSSSQGGYVPASAQSVSVRSSIKASPHASPSPRAPAIGSSAIAAGATEAEKKRMSPSKVNPQNPGLSPKSLEVPAPKKPVQRNRVFDKSPSRSPRPDPARDARDRKLKEKEQSADSPDDGSKRSRSQPRFAEIEKLPEGVDMWGEPINKNPGGGRVGGLAGWNRDKENAKIEQKMIEEGSHPSLAASGHVSGSLQPSMGGSSLHPSMVSSHHPSEQHLQGGAASSGSVPGSMLIAGNMSGNMSGSGNASGSYAQQNASNMNNPSNSYANSSSYGNNTGGLHGMSQHQPSGMQEQSSAMQSPSRRVNMSSPRLLQQSSPRLQNQQNSGMQQSSGVQQSSAVHQSSGVQLQSSIQQQSASGVSMPQQSGSGSAGYKSNLSRSAGYHPEDVMGSEFRMFEASAPSSAHGVQQSAHGVSVQASAQGVSVQPSNAHGPATSYSGINRVSPRQTPRGIQQTAVGGLQQSSAGGFDGYDSSVGGLVPAGYGSSVGAMHEGMMPDGIQESAQGIQESAESRSANAQMPRNGAQSSAQQGSSPKRMAPPGKEPAGSVPNNSSGAPNSSRDDVAGTKRGKSTQRKKSENRSQGRGRAASSERNKAAAGSSAALGGKKTKRRKVEKLDFNQDKEHYRSSGIDMDEL